MGSVRSKMVPPRRAALAPFGEGEPACQQLGKVRQKPTEIGNQNAQTRKHAAEVPKFIGPPDVRALDSESFGAANGARLLPPFY